MAYYSFRVFTKHPVGIPQPLVLLDTGANVFNAEVQDIEGFKALLTSEGVIIKEVHRLDAHEASDSSFEDVPLALQGDVSV